jgi:hypothetical protein
VRAGTIFHGSRLPLTKWFYAYYLMRSRPNVAPCTLSRELGVKWDTALRMRQVLSHAMADGGQGLNLDRLVEPEADQEGSNQQSAD